MAEFFKALLNPDFPFVRNAFIVGILSSISFGIVGTYVVSRRISYIAGAISHSVLGGIGLALYMQLELGVTWFTPMIGATVAALVSAIIIGLVNLYAGEREDTVIGAIWAIGMATGLLFIHKTSGYIDPMTFLYSQRQ